MSKGEVIHVSETGAKKAGNLERFDLLPDYPLRALGLTYQGAAYPPATLNGLQYSLLDFWSGVDNDPFTPDVPTLAYAAREAVGLISVHVGDDWVAPEGVTGVAAIPPEPIRLLAEHYGRGARKYEDHNWRKGYAWGLSFAALNRHLSAHRSGEFVDEETGSLHLVAVLWHIFTLLTFTQEYPELDDRWSTVRERGVAHG